jgi:hypothetical protein
VVGCLDFGRQSAAQFGGLLTGALRHALRLQHVKHQLLRITFSLHSLYAQALQVVYLSKAFREWGICRGSNAATICFMLCFSDRLLFCSLRALSYCICQPLCRSQQHGVVPCAFTCSHVLTLRVCLQAQLIHLQCCLAWQQQQ